MKDEWVKLDRLAKASDGGISFVPQADPHLLAMADAERSRGAVIVNCSDRYRTWTSNYPHGLPEIVRVQHLGGMLSFAFEKGAKPIAVPVTRDLRLYGIDLAEATSRHPHGPAEPASVKLLTSRNRASTTLRARLVVFVLDASGSMILPACGACNTFDGRRKSDHLAEIFKGSVSRLARSKASASFYTGLIAFAGDASVIEIEGARMAHISRFNNCVSDPSFNYASKAHGNGTNLSAALESAVSLIDDVLAAPEAKYIATKWSACIVLITDGLDTSSEDRVRETVAHIGMSRAGLASGQIDVGCVGIGSDVRDALLSDLASTPSATAKQILVRQGLASKLITRQTGEPAMAIRVSAQDPSYLEAIRGFVDVVSQTTQG